MNTPIEFKYLQEHKDDCNIYIYIRKKIYHMIVVQFHLPNMYILLGSEVDKLSEILIKTSNAMEYIKSDIQNIEAPIIDDPII